MPAHPSILLIDDSPGECELLRLALKQTGLDVTLYTEHDAEAALHFLQTLAHRSPLPSVILLDLQLHGEHGLSFLRRIRTDSHLAMVPVVILTTSDDNSDLTDCYAGGANGYVVKPGTFEELCRCLEALCRFWMEWNVVPVAPFHPDATAGQAISNRSGRQ